MTQRAVVRITALLLGLAGCAEDAASGAICDEDALVRALASASPGSTVEIGPCRIAGSFVVPAGVELRGSDESSTLVAVSLTAPVVWLTPGAQPSRLANVSVEANGSIAVFAPGDGAGAVEMVDVSVTATRGAAIGIENVASAVLRDVHADGMVTPEVPISDSTTAEEVATHGVVLKNVAGATLENVTARQFAKVGVLLYESASSWMSGQAGGGVGSALLVWGGSADLYDVELSGSRQSMGFLPPTGGLFTEEAVVETWRVRAERSAFYGLVHVRAHARHHDPQVADNGHVGVWVQGCDSFSIDGADSVLRANRFAGLFATQSSGVSISDARIEGTLLGDSAGPFGMESPGDGIQLDGSLDGLSIVGVALVDNGRAGVLLDLADETINPGAFENVRADASDDGSFGVIAQNGVAPAGWDVGVMRDETARANDGAFAVMMGTLPLVELPPSELGSEGNLGDSGDLAALVGITMPEHLED